MGIIIVNEKIRDFENISLIIYKLSLQLFFGLFAAIIRFILFTSFCNNRLSLRLQNPNYLGGLWQETWYNTL